MIEAFPAGVPCIDQLAEALDVGMIWVDSCGDFAAANATAAQLLGATNHHDMSAAWLRLRETAGLDGDLAGAAAAASPGVDVDVAVGAVTRRLRARIHKPAVGAWPGHLVTLSDLELIGALQTDLLAAARHRNLLRTQAAAAHDLKGILNTLSLSAQVQRRLLGGIQTRETEALAQCSKYSTTLFDQVGRLARLVQGIFGRTAEARGRSEELDLRACIEDVAARVAPLCARHSLVLRVELGRDPIWVRGQRELLHEALVSLVVNAVDSARPGGTVAIGAELVDRHAQIRVTDCGPEGPESLAEHIGDLDCAGTRLAADTGLRVVWLVVRDHGGRVRAWTQAKGGGTVELLLPVR